MSLLSLLFLFLHLIPNCLLNLVKTTSFANFSNKIYFGKHRKYLLLIEELKHVNPK